MCAFIIVIHCRLLKSASLVGTMASRWRSPQKFHQNSSIRILFMIINSTISFNIWFNAYIKINFFSTALIAIIVNSISTAINILRKANYFIYLKSWSSLQIRHSGKPYTVNIILASFMLSVSFTVSFWPIIIVIIIIIIIVVVVVQAPYCTVLGVLLRTHIAKCRASLNTVGRGISSQCMVW